MDGSGDKKAEKREGGDRHDSLLMFGKKIQDTNRSKKDNKRTAVIHRQRPGNHHISDDGNHNKSRNHGDQSAGKTSRDEEGAVHSRRQRQCGKQDLPPAHDPLSLTSFSRASCRRPRVLTRTRVCHRSPAETISSARELTLRAAKDAGLHLVPAQV